MTDDQTRFIDAESWQGGADEKLSFRMILLEHLRRIAKLGSVELTGGYWQDRTKVMGGTSYVERFYVPDSREEYSNAVDTLFDLLFPHFDGEFQQDYEEFSGWEEKQIAYLKKICQHGKDFDDEKFKTESCKSIKRELFRIINKFLFRTRYLESKSFEEEA